MSDSSQKAVPSGVFCRVTAALSRAIVLLSLWASAVAGELPVNTWTQVSEEKTGGTIGAIVYVPEHKGMLLYGYPSQGAASEVDLYVMAKQAWEGQIPAGAHLGRGVCYTVWKNGRPMLPTPNRVYWLAGQACYVPTVKKALYFAGGATFYFNPAAKQWEDLKIPVDQAPPDVMLGALAWDPVKNRVILFGGGYIGAYKSPGTDNSTVPPPLGKPWTPQMWTPAERRGTWAFDPEKTTWKRIVTGSEPFRDLPAKCMALDERNTDLMASIRGLALEYGDLFAAKKPAELASLAGKLSADAATLAKELAAGAGVTDAYEAGQCKAAAAELDKAKVDLDAAAAQLKTEDGWAALRAAEKARGEIIEAAEAVAASPLPRYYGSLVTDTKNNVLVLFGGHGGTMRLGDTWIFDLAKEQWRTSKSAAHPPLNEAPAMAFDPGSGRVLLRGDKESWLFDAARDEWKTVKLGGADKMFYRWTSLACDPTEKALVALTVNYDAFGPCARRVAMLKLDASAAMAPATPGGPVWKWMNDKYDVCWSNLPASQAEYKSRVAARKKFLDDRPANTWTKCPTTYSAQSRSYGSFCFDWDRGQVDYWGGGHSAYMGNEFSQYDVKSGLWMESWAPDLPAWPFGSPDGPGWTPSMYHRQASSHGYHHYVYWSDLKKVVFYGAGPIYDPDRMRWTDLSLTRNGKGSDGISVDMAGTPGLFRVSAQYYRGGPFGVWKGDAKAMTLTRLEGSDPGFGGNDRMKAVFDSKRHRILWFGVQSGTNKVCNELWAFPLDKGKWERLTPAMEPADAVAPGMSAWGNSYSAQHDVMVILPGNANQATWVYDCGKNVLRKAMPGPKTGSSGLVYDAAHDAFIATEETGGGVGPVNLWFMRYKP